MKIDEMLRLACLYAEQDRLSLLDAYKNNQDEQVARDAEAFLKKLRKYRIKRWGNTELEANLKDVPMLTTSEIRSKLDPANDAGGVE